MKRLLPRLPKKVSLPTKATLPFLLLLASLAFGARAAARPRLVQKRPAAARIMSTLTQARTRPPVQVAFRNSEVLEGS